MRQVVGFLNCLKKNGLSNEKYVPRKRPRDFSRAGTLVVDMAAEQGQDRLPTRGRSRMPPAVRRKGAYFVLRSPHSQARLTITPVARYTRTAASLEASRWSQRPFLFSARAGRAFSAAGHQQMPSSRSPGKETFSQAGRNDFYERGDSLIALSSSSLTTLFGRWR
jgi:hypothetical protein